MARSASQFQLNPEQQKLVEDNLNLARREAWRYQRRTEIEYSILQSVAFYGLCQAAYKYDGTMLNPRNGKPMKFSSIAVPYVRGSILHFIRDRTYLLRLSHRMRENWLQGRKLLYAGYSDIEIAEILNIEVTEWLDTRVTCSGPPLELKEQGAPTIDPVVPEADMTQQYLEIARQAMERLTEADQKRIAGYFGARAVRAPVEALHLVTEYMGTVACPEPDLLGDVV